MLCEVFWWNGGKLHCQGSKCARYLSIYCTMWDCDMRYVTPRSCVLWSRVSCINMRWKGLLKIGDDVDFCHDCCAHEGRFDGINIVADILQNDVIRCPTVLSGFCHWSKLPGEPFAHRVKFICEIYSIPWWRRATAEDKRCIGGVERRRRRLSTWGWGCVRIDEENCWWVLCWVICYMLGYLYAWIWYTSVAICIWYAFWSIRCRNTNNNRGIIPRIDYGRPFITILDYDRQHIEGLTAFLDKRIILQL